METPDEDYDTDLVRRRSVDEWDGGLIAGYEHEAGRHGLGLGGELRLHRGHHFGDVRWALVYPAGLPRYHRFYDYEVEKTSLSLYLRDRVRLAPRWSLEAALQLQHHRMSMGEDKRYGTSFERDYSFLSPRLGLVWQPSQGRSFFLSAAHGTREPGHKDIYDAGDFWSGPGAELLQGEDYVSHFENGRYVGPEADPEKVLDLELGGRLNGERCALDATLYWMDFRDEIVPWAGALDDNQLPTNGNAEQSRHSGLELAGRLELIRGWTLAGTAFLTRDRFVKYTEHYWTPDWDIESAVYDGQAIPGYPMRAWQLRLDGRLLGAEPWISLRGVGRQWLDGRNLEERSVEPFTLLDAGLGLSLPGLAPMKGARLSARVNNLLNAEYESAGYIESDDLEPRWFVGAPRNYYLGLSLVF